MSESEFYISTSSGQLHARLVIPRSVLEKPESVFVICHGLLDTKYAPLFCALQRFLPFASVAFDFRGNGLSTGQTSYGNYYEEAEDIKGVIEYINSGALSTHGVSRVVGIVGHSKGASSVLLFACKYPHLCPSLLVTISARYLMSRELPNRWKPHHLQALETHGRFLWRKYGGHTLLTAGVAPEVPVREYWIAAEHLQLRDSTDMSVVQTLPFGRCFVLNVMGGSDTVVPAADVWDYDRVMRLGTRDDSRVATRVVPEATHFWNSEQELDALEDVVLTWLKSILPLAKL
ncbi:hypothetical protein IW146_003640 [Coemansia sp. RSA 922]|nr:hypothetical protein H4S03_001049 [Coemansia sp. S3946]KAJ2052491.1 hypothetical protein H4S04_001301 [Coemansia sp. S16]KAJ2064016.1 hypothetical protein GGI08_002451 [Coemansia sp. S2]KAJ2113727.1 hypothetical protein IW146_003640 [Coemansia sp. RSA 922]KAJ2350614.1 hypothetical protein GGH92_002286 [Coemansia sp. RSA 2673]